MILLLQGTEQSIVFQPTCVLGTELVVSRSQVLALSGFKVCPRLFEQSLLKWNYRVIVDPVRSKVTFTIARLQQPVRDEGAGTDHEYVTGERRQRLIRRVSIASRAKG